jgi:PilZ domain
MPEPKAERRRQRRVPQRASAALKFVNGGVHQDSANIEDVSKHSVFFYTEAHLVEGSSIELVMPLPPEITGTDDQVVVRCKARIVRVQQRAGDGKMGIAAVFDDYEILEAKIT